MEERQNEE
jgi:hypothetical protein